MPLCASLLRLIPALSFLSVNFFGAVSRPTTSPTRQRVTFAVTGLCNASNHRSLKNDTPDSILGIEGPASQRDCPDLSLAH